MGIIENALSALHRGRSQLELWASMARSNHPDAGEMIENTAHRSIVADKYDVVPWVGRNIGETVRLWYAGATQEFRTDHRFAEYTWSVCEFQGSWFVLRQHALDSEIAVLSSEDRSREYERLLAVATSKDVPFLNERIEAVRTRAEYLARKKIV